MIGELTRHATAAHPYDERQTGFDAEGYGVDESRDLVIYHRWGPADDGALEKFIVVLNLSGYSQVVDVPFSDNGRWRELLEGWEVEVSGWRLPRHAIGSHWGRIFFRRIPPV